MNFSFSFSMGLIGSRIKEKEFYRMSAETMKRDLAKRNGLLIEKINELNQLKTKLESSFFSEETPTSKSIQN